MSATATPLARDEAGYAADNRKWWVLKAIVIGTFMSVVDATVVNIALPKMISVFSTDVQQVQMTASVRAFDDTFLFGAVLCIPAVAAAFLVRNTKTGAGGRHAMLGAE
ncbi:MAG TPA: hypothetical protein VNL16_07280 [Chloroflexota bacterium]|nr:hypothetical protein [Chloroflexota bacterium]